MKGNGSKRPIILLNHTDVVYTNFIHRFKRKSVYEIRVIRG